jgi:two-component system nitrogen regulation sensor histidine kinase NtrY
MSSETSITIKRRSAWRRIDAWSRRVGLERKAALTLAVAAIASAIVTYATISASPASGLEPGTELALIVLNLILLLIFGAIVAKRLVEIWAQRRRGLAGSRLHIRLVMLFSAVAVTPTIVVAIFSYLLLSVGMDNWFSDKVRTALSESRTVAQAYLEEHQANIRSDALGLASTLNNYAPLLPDSARLSDFIDGEAERRSIPEAVVIDTNHNNQIVGRSALSFSIGLEAPPAWAISKAANGEVAIITSANEDRVRALVRLDEFRWLPGYMVYVGRAIDPLVISHVKDNNEAVDQYERLEGQRSTFQNGFMLIFGVGALLLLLAAVWVGLNFATQISRRISGLVVAAEKVRGGDLSARVIEVDENDEFGSLSRAFNRMTGQLESQQSELVEANRQLDLRRQFTEAVLSGVSAGVIGLDDQAHIHLPNRSASTLLSIELDQHLGQPLATVVPEMAPLLNQLFRAPERLVEGQIRLMAGGSAMVLLVRIASERGQGERRGFVVTFDDITELLAAQRKAAWADVARRIAHEIKNPLTPIQLSAERLKRKYLREIKTDPETFAICTDTIIRQVGDIGRMVDEFSSFARMPAPVMKPEKLQDITRQAVFLQRTANSEIEFTVEIPTEPVEISCDSRQISQALINLLQNAVDSIHARQVAQAGDSAVPDPGRILVTLQSRGNRTILSVLDNGKGLPKEGRESLTEPYVTTRAKGTGLGLAIVKKIMEDHAGELLLQDGPTGGACVGLVFIGRAAQMPKRRAGARDEVGVTTEVAIHGA